MNSCVEINQVFNFLVSMKKQLYYSIICMKIEMSKFVYNNRKSLNLKKGFKIEPANCSCETDVNFPSLKIIKSKLSCLNENNMKIMFFFFVFQ